MEESINLLRQAYLDFRQDVEAFERSRKPTDGLLGFGKTLQNDSCQERFDQRLSQIVETMRMSSPSPEDAEAAVRLMLFRDHDNAWSREALWMLFAAERHSLPLIPFLTPDAAAACCREYGDRYKRWDRLPAQKQVYAALKKRSVTK